MIVALFGFISVSGYAQNKKDCTCKNKVHKTMAIHTKNIRYSHPAASLPDYVTVLPYVPNTNIVRQQPAEDCYTYRKDNIVVQECPATNNTPALQYEGEGTYMGYYPEARDRDVQTADAPQHTVINNYKGVAPADGNSCNDCTPE